MEAPTFGSDFCYRVVNEERFRTTGPNVGGGTDICEIWQRTSIVFNCFRIVFKAGGEEWAVSPPVVFCRGMRLPRAGEEVNKKIYLKFR